MKTTTEMMQEYSQLCTEVGVNTMNKIIATADAERFGKKVDELTGKLYELNKAIVLATKEEKKPAEAAGTVTEPKPELHVVKEKLEN